MGGFVHLRHNEVRDLEAELISRVCSDVKVEPKLLPLSGNQNVKGNTEDEARLDVSMRGFWRPLQRTFVDIRVFHPNAPSYVHTPLHSLYVSHQSQKKREYNERVIEVERASFTPLVFSSFGGMSPECTTFHKNLAHLIAEKTSENYADVMSYIRRRIRFSLLRTTLIALRGERIKPGTKRPKHLLNDDIDFGLIEAAHD